MAGAAKETTLGELAGEQSRAAAALGGDLRPLLKIFGVAIAADAKKNFEAGAGPDGQGWPPLAHPRPNSRGADQPLRDTGLLFASVAGHGQGHLEEIGETALVQGTVLPYASIHQEGGTIKPKGHPFLAIPATRQAARVGSPRDFPAPLVPIIGKKGGVLVERKSVGRGKKKTVRETVQYYLARSVTIPARPFLGFGQRLLDTIDRLAGDWLEKTFGGGKP